MRTCLFLLAIASLAAGCRNRSSSIERCTPGEVLTIGCNGTVGLPCQGDPTLTVCDAGDTFDAEQCTSSSPGFLVRDDDGGGGRCPLIAAVTCPASGRIAVNPNPFSGAGGNWGCDYEVRVVSGPTTPTPTSSIETCTPGSFVSVGCTGSVGLTCTGDPTLTICDAALATTTTCTSGGTGYLGYSDDASGRCPQVDGVTCPSGGRIVVVARPFGSDTGWTCPYAVAASPVAP